MNETWESWRQEPLTWRGVLAVLAGLLAVAAVWQAWAWWMKPAAVEFDNLKYIQLLTTAVSSRDSGMVDRVELAILDRRQQGKISDREIAEFDAIIQLAREDRWETADRACYALAEAQLNRRRKTPPSEDGHDHDHGHVRSAG